MTIMNITKKMYPCFTYWIMKTRHLTIQLDMIVPLRQVSKGLEAIINYLQSIHLNFNTIKIYKKLEAWFMTLETVFVYVALFLFPPCMQKNFYLILKLYFINQSITLQSNSSLLVFNKLATKHIRVKVFKQKLLKVLCLFIQSVFK